MNTITSIPITYNNNQNFSIAYHSVPDEPFLFITDSHIDPKYSNPENFMQHASNGINEYVWITRNWVSYSVPESSFYKTSPDLYPFVPQSVSFVGNGNSGYLEFQGTPEPSTILTFMIVLIGLFFKRFRR